MAHLIPAILTRDPKEVREKIKILEDIPEITEVHIDFEDGKFVPNETVMPSDLFGLSTRLKIDAHMMVQRPERFFHDLEHLGVAQADIHYESFHHTKDLIAAVANLKAMDIRAGVVVNPDTEIDIFKNLVSQIDVAFLMSVHPGFQGRPFLVHSLDRLQILRKNNPDAIIQIDGGVNAQNLQTVRAHGADRIVVGSAVWVDPDVKKTVRELLDKIK